MTDRMKSFALMTALAVASATAFWLLRDHWAMRLGLRLTCSFSPVR